MALIRRFVTSVGFVILERLKVFCDIPTSWFSCAMLLKSDMYKPGVKFLYNSLLSGQMDKKKAPWTAAFYCF